MPPLGTSGGSTQLGIREKERSQFIVDNIVPSSSSLAWVIEEKISSVSISLFICTSFCPYFRILFACSDAMIDSD